MNIRIIHTLSIVLITFILSLLWYLFESYSFPLNLKIPIISQWFNPVPKIETDLSNNIPNWMWEKEYKQIYKSNSWFTTAYEFPTNAIYFFPGALKIDTSGIILSSLESRGTGNTVFGSFKPDCSLRFGQETIKNSEVAEYGEWHIRLTLQLSNNERADIEIIQGMPIINILYPGQQMTVHCLGTQTSSNNQISLWQNERFIIAAQAKDTKEVIPAGELIQFSSSSNHYRLMWLPNKYEETLKLFTDQPWQLNIHTKTGWSMNNNIINTKYSWLSSDDNQPIEVLTTIFPHHKTYLDNQYLELGSYSSAIGELTLVKTMSFSTNVPEPILPLQFREIQTTSESNKLIELINQDAEKYLNEIPPDGIYFKGTWLGALSSLIQLADIYQQETIRSKLLKKLENELFKGINDFSYNDKLGMMISNNSEFGNDRGNDHHLQYGYYIRSAAILKSSGVLIPEKMEKIIDQLVLDIANMDKNSDQFPYLRHYSIYEGHSWADGQGNTSDGNNQESSSEALQAWYSLYLWGLQSNNRNLSDLGKWLFSQELSGMKAYWFGYENPFPNGYDHSMASIIWGGKRDYATWFSAQDLHIYGIQWLPITPASIYLKDIPNYSLHKKTIINAYPDPYAHEWGDLYAAYQSFWEPEMAFNNIDTALKNDGLKLDSLLYQTVLSNLNN